MSQVQEFYHVSVLLGQGKYGMVFLGTTKNEAPACEVAIKVFKYPERKSMVNLEMQIMTEIRKIKETSESHNIISVKTCELSYARNDELMPCFVMECLKGQELFYRIITR